MELTNWRCPVSSEIQLKVLSGASVDTLRVLSTRGEAGRIWSSALEETVAKHSLEFVDSPYLIRRDTSLRTGDGVSAIRELDAANSSRIHQLLPKLSRAEATDERLWITLALGEFGEYSRDRWPLGNVPASRHLENHLFLGTARRRERDQAISRLWWTGEYVRRFVDPAQAIPTLNAVFSNSDLVVQLLGRPNVATIAPLAKAVLYTVRERFGDEGTKYSRDAFRSFMESLDLLAGRRILGVLTDEEVARIVEESFDHAFDGSSTR